MKAALEIINDMRDEGIIDRYAIGGAVGATFYMEPIATMDVDIFISFKGQQPAGSLISLSPIYAYLQSRGCEIRGEYIVVGDWPVQFLPTSDALSEEALAAAVMTELEGVSIHVMTAEHLVAIALQLGRAKDHARVVQFVDSDSLDRQALNEILQRHDLTAKWKQFEGLYLSGGGEQ
jgi:hypothetical protein